MDNDHLTFLSYASQDQARVEEYYTYLKGKGIPIWMDKYEIRGDQNWEFEIRKALRKSSIIVIFLSNNSITKRGYVQREIRGALDKAQEKLSDDIYIIPVTLDADIIIPHELNHIQAIKSDRVDSFDELERSISHQLAELGQVQTNTEQRAGFRWHRENVTEIWEGLPGYDFSFDVMRIGSTEHPELSKITDILKGHAIDALLNERMIKFEQSPELHNFGQDRYRRENSSDAHCRNPLLTGRILSIIYDISSYGAGAAHPNHGHTCYNFIIDPLVKIGGIEGLFTDTDSAFTIVQEIVRRELNRPDKEGNVLEDQWIADGSSKWDDFETFALSKEGLLVLFGPYHVGPYAAGSHVATVPYGDIVKLLKKEIVAALQIEHLTYEPWPFGSKIDLAADESDERGQI